MSIAEGIFLGLLFMGGYQGYKRGLLIEVTGLLALILGVIAGIIFIEEGKMFISQFFNTYSPVLSFFSFIAIFVCVIILANLLGRTLKATIYLTPMGHLDRLAGAVLGVLKWIFYISAALWILDVLEIEINAVSESQWYTGVHSFAPFVVQKVEIWFPSVKSFYSEIRVFLESLNMS